MDILYYPEMFPSENTLKSIVLFWGNVRSIIPNNKAKIVSEYLQNESSSFQKYFSDSINAKQIVSEARHPIFHDFDNKPYRRMKKTYYTGQRKKPWVSTYSQWENALECFKKVRESAGEPIVDILVPSKEETERAGIAIFNLICDWNKTTHFYDSLKIDESEHRLDNDVTLIGFDEDEYDWLYTDKLNKDLVDLLIEERLVLSRDDKIFGHERIFNSFMSVLAEEIKKQRNIRIISNDEMSVVTKSGVGKERLCENDSENAYDLVSLAIPNVFIEPSLIESLSWERILKIRKELLPLSQNYFNEIEDYQNRINLRINKGKDEEAFDVLCEFCERISISFHPFAKETSKILNLVKNPFNISLLNGIMLPTFKLLNQNPEVSKHIDMLTIAATAAHFGVSQNNTVYGFDYLSSLNRKLDIEKIRNMVTCIIPKNMDLFLI